MIPAIKNKPVHSATAVLFFILVLIVALFSAKDVIAGSAATLVIKSRVDTGPWTTDSAIYPLKGQKVILKIDAIPGGTVRWYRIIPDISKIYKNCNHPWEKDPYKWVGLAKIDYSKKELATWRGCWEIEPFSKKSQDTTGGQAQKSLGAPSAAGEESQYCHKDVGSFWFQVEVEQDRAVQRSPGIEDINVKGLPPQVFRVSVRESGGFLGYLTSFFNVPGVFGSIPYQSNNYIGSDCCDLLTAAYGKWKGKVITKDYNVDMLVSRLPKRATANITEGVPDKTLKWGQEIRSGDLIAVKYVGAKRYQHIGALYNDADKNGVLSEGDQVIHAGPWPLHFSYLKEGCFDGHVIILDPQLSLLSSGKAQPLRVAEDLAR